MAKSALLQSRLGIKTGNKPDKPFLNKTNVLFHWRAYASTGRIVLIPRTNKIEGKLAVSLPGLILGLHPANERRRYKVTPSLIGWAQT